MKKIFVTLHFLLCVILAIPSFVYANDIQETQTLTEKHISQFSSSNIDETVLKALDLNPTDKIVKLYNMSIVVAFSKYDTIGAVMDSEFVDQIFYVVLSDGGELEVYIVRNGSSPVKAIEENLVEESDLLTYYSDNAIKKISEDIEVYNVYYLWARPYYEGIALYYETNMGDYVYWNGTEAGECLMPSVVFVDYMRTLYHEMFAPSLSVKGSSNGGSTYNIANYKINSSEFNPHILPVALNDEESKQEVAIIVVCALVAVVTVGVVCLKQKYKHKKKG